MTRPTRARAGSGTGYALAIGVGALAAVASGMTLAMAVWLLPALFTAIVEREPGRPLARAMMLFGIAASLPGLVALWSSGSGLAAGLEIAISPAKAARSWSAQGGAWLMAELLPVLLKVRAEATSRGPLKQLRLARQALEEEWSPPIP